MSWLDVILLLASYLVIALASYEMGRGDEMLTPDDDRAFAGLRPKRDAEVT